MKIERLSAANDSELVEFLDRLGSGPGGEFVLGYHYPVNRDALLTACGPGTEAAWLAARTPGGELVGVLPGMVKTHGGISCYNSLPFFGPNVGVLASPESAGNYGPIAKALIGAALDLAREKKAATAVFYSPFDPHQRIPSHGALDTYPEKAVVTRETLYLSLPTSPPFNWDSKIRYDLRKAEKEGVTVSEGLVAGQLDRIFEIYRSNCEQFGIPLKPKEALRRIVEGDPDRVEVSSAHRDGEIIGALIVLQGPQTVSYYLPCTDTRFRSLQPGTLLVEHACRKAVSRGKRYWNWESSPDRTGGVYHFKKKWGSQATSYQVVAVALQDLAPLKDMGASRLSEGFRFFYVYPYDRLGFTSPSLQTPEPALKRVGHR